MNPKPYQLNVCWALRKIKDVRVSKSPVLKVLRANLDVSQHWPWTEFNKIEVDRGWFDESRPTRQECWIDDLFTGATLPVFIRTSLNLDDGLQQGSENPFGNNVSTYPTREPMHPFGWTLQNRLSLGTIIFIRKADDGGFRHGCGIFLGLSAGCFSIGVGILNLNANAIASSCGITGFHVRLYMVSVEKFARIQLAAELGMNGMKTRGCVAWIHFAFQDTAEHVDQRSM
jgi:hypothetical protein